MMTTGATETRVSFGDLVAAVYDDVGRLASDPGLVARMVATRLGRLLGQSRSRAEAASARPPVARSRRRRREES